MPYGDYSVAPWLDQFFGNVLQQLGLFATTWRMGFLETWSHFETAGGQKGTGVSYNPLGTSYYLPGAKPNTGGQENVWLFPDVPTGAQATANTIRNYTGVVQSLEQERVQPGVANTIGRTWGTGGFANLLQQGWAPPTPSRQIPGLGLSTVPDTIPPSPIPETPTLSYTPSGGLINIPQSSLTPGQFNVITTNGGTVGGLEGWTLWQRQSNGNWQQWNKGDYIAPNTEVGVLPAGLSLPHGLTAR